MNKLLIVAAVSAMFASSAFAGSTPSTIAIGSLNIGAGVSGSVGSIGAGAGTAGAFNTQTASFTSTPSSSSNNFTTTNIGEGGTTATSGQSLAFTTQSGNANAGALSIGGASATETGSIAAGGGGELGGSAVGGSNASNVNVSAATGNEANGNFSATTSQYGVGLTQTVSYGPVYSVAGGTLSGGAPNVSDTITVSGSASNLNEQWTGQAALTAAGVSGVGTNAATGIIGAGVATVGGAGSDNSFGNVVLSNAGFYGNAGASNVSTQVLTLNSPSNSVAP